MATTTTRWTVDDLERSSPDGRYELIDGELVEMAPAGGEHCELGMGFGARLWLQVRERRLGKVYGADTGFVLGSALLVVPDVAFVRADRLPSPPEQRTWPRLAADLVVEVVSPTDRATDVRAKVMRYLDAGVPLIWVFYPRTRIVSVVAPDRDERILREGEVLDGGAVLPEFRLAVADIFD